MSKLCDCPAVFFLQVESWYDFYRALNIIERGLSKKNFPAVPSVLCIFDQVLISRRSGTRFSSLVDPVELKIKEGTAGQSLTNSPV